MKKLIIFGVWILWLFSVNWMGCEIRKYSQYNQTLYKIVNTVDLFNFVNSGGGSFGYQNYYKWQYAVWINSPERSFLERAMFWKVGILYDATNPPKKYEFPIVQNVP